MSKANREEALEAIERDGKLSAGAKLLLVLVGDLVGDGRLLEAGCEYLAEKAGAEPGTVWRWRKELVTAGYLIPERVSTGGRGLTNQYRFSWDNPSHTRGLEREKPRENPSHPREKPRANPSHSRTNREQEGNRNMVEHSTNPSPARNDPTACGHRALDDEGYCAACSSQIIEKVPA